MSASKGGLQPNFSSKSSASTASVVTLSQPSGFFLDLVNSLNSLLPSSARIDTL
ncbi:unknown [Salmonella phage FelixO1]|uniref:Uncharacterized protein n=1 Tax=Salmonella phage Felix O1 (isolate Felix O1-VT1) TaxID=1283336 RepID=Q6KGA7_BPFO1|nr:unknown [Salmonella phage FelixO1]